MPVEQWWRTTQIDVHIAEDLTECWGKWRQGGKIEWRDGAIEFVALMLHLEDAAIDLESGSMVVHHVVISIEILAGKLRGRSAQCIR